MSPDQILIGDLEAAIAEYSRRSAVVQKLVETGLAALEAGEQSLAVDVMRRASSTAKAIAQAGGRGKIVLFPGRAAAGDLDDDELPF